MTRWMGFLPVGLLAAAALMGRTGGADVPTKQKTDVRLRRPVAVVAADGGHRLLVANRRAGSVSVIDVDRRRVIAEVDVGRSVADLADGGDGRFLAVDETAGELIVLAGRPDSLTVVGRIRVPDSPVSVRRVSGKTAVVACLWPRQLAIVELAEDGRPRLRKVVALPFAPRGLLPLPPSPLPSPPGGEGRVRGGSSRVVVADAFGGHLAVVDADRGAVESVRAVPGHNIRGLTLSSEGDRLLISQQVLAEDTPTTADDVRWGNVITNAVRSLALDDVRKPDADLLRHSRLRPLGEFRRGAADPAGLAVVGGRLIVALSGTGEVVFLPAAGGDEHRLTVGRRPTVLAVAGRLAFVADTLGDSVSIVDVEDRKSVAVVALGPAPALGPAERGERLFFDGRLSADGWMSCHSCHSDGHTNGLRSDTLGDGSYGAPKRVSTLRGVGDTGPWAWDGHVTELRAQLRQSVRTTMHGPAPSDRQLADLEAYLRTLPPPPAARADRETDAAVRRGREVFQTQGCARCHAPPTYTSPRTYDVGLPDEMGKAAFNPPSLRGVVHGTAFFHDGRAATLEEVFTRHHHQVSKDLPRSRRDDLLTFLRSL